MKKVEIIGAACGYGAQNHACQDGPEVLRALGFFSLLHDSGVDFFWDEVIHLPRGLDEEPLHAVSDICASLSERVARAYADGNFPLVVGGDHSCAIGTWSGVSQALGGSGELGLLWIDAHMDSHTFATTPSGAIHGMPLACLLGYGEAELTHLGQDAPKLLPENVCLLGTRSFENGEASLLAQLGVRVYGMAEIHQRGFAAVFDEALAHVQRHTVGFGVSLDLDALDPSEEAGVGSPAPGGIFKRELVQAFRGLHNHPHFLAMEIVEYNPYLDNRFVTAQAASELIAAATPF
jgi:arginase